MPEHTIAENLQRLVNAKENIGKAITAKGGIVNSGDGLEEYSNDISTIKNELTSININENGTYSNGIEDTISTNNYPIIINANGDNIKSIIIDGNSNQASTPTPTNPVDVNGVGERTGNLFDVNRLSSTAWTIDEKYYIDGAVSDNKSDIRPDTVDVSVSNGSDLTVTARSYYGAGFVIAVIPNTTYTISFVTDTVVPNNKSIATITYVDANENFLNYTTVYGGTSQATFTTPNTAYYIIIVFRYTLNTITYSNIMLNTGSQPLPYEPYGYKIPISSAGQTNNIYLGEVQSTRRIKKLVLTGEEAISAWTGAGSGYFYIYTTDIITFSTTDKLWLSNQYSAKKQGESWGDYVISCNPSVQGRLVIKNTDYPTVPDFKAYLAQQYSNGTPVTIWYVLAEPTTGIVNEPLMRIGDYKDQLTLTDSTTIIPTISGNNTIDYNLILKPSNTQITYNKININKTITSDTLPITINSDGSNATISINGNTAQNGTPSPSNPVDVNGVGDKSNQLIPYPYYTADGTVAGVAFDTTDNGIIKASGVNSSALSFYLISRYPFKAGTYTISISGSVQGASLRFYNATKRTYISGNVTSTLTFTIEDDGDELSLFFYQSTVDTDVNINCTIMLNSGSEPLPYELYNPYYTIPILCGNQTTNIYLGETQSTRAVKKLVLTGTNADGEWKKSSARTGSFYLNVGRNGIIRQSICDRAINVSMIDNYNYGNIYVEKSGADVLINLWLFDTNISLDDFKAYLAQQYANGTPVTVWYVLATPETATINEPLMKIGDYADTLSTTITTIKGQNILNINTTIKPSLTSITYNELNTIGWKEINVNVLNTYTNEDNGKVVNNNTLIAQTAYPTEITENNTYDTTLYNSIVVNVPTGGSAGTKGDVTFYDYDGTVIASYSKDEFADLSALPANPSHEGLTAQGWNWSLSDAKTYVNKYGKLNIGQMYVTDDGKTRIYITLTEGRTSPILQLYLNSNPELDIDWGDGGSHSTFTGYGYQSERHNYATPGDYVIAISVTTGSFVLRSSSTTVSSILWNENNNANSPDRAYANSIKKIEIGTGVSNIGDRAFNGCQSLSSITIPNTVTGIGTYAFNNCYSLQSITVPDSVTSISSYVFNGCYSLSSITIPNSVTIIDNSIFGSCYSLTSITIHDSVKTIYSSAFSGCYSLQSITIPDSVTSIYNNAFNACYSLQSITIPNGVKNIGSDTFSSCYSLSAIIIGNSVTSIGNNAFRNCKSLAAITIPDKVTSIGTQAFNGCSYMESIKFTSTTPPTVSNSNTWTSVPPSCIIFVPINTFAAYTTATNYPNPSSFTYLVYGTYASGDTLPSTSTDNYSLTWYATIADAIAETNPVTTGNGNEVYARCTAI